jgi:hypothetical protein
MQQQKAGPLMSERQRPVSLVTAYQVQPTPGKSCKQQQQQGMQQTLGGTPVQSLKNAHKNSRRAVLQQADWESHAKGNSSSNFCGHQDHF